MKKIETWKTKIRERLKYRYFQTLLAFGWWGMVAWLITLGCESGDWGYMTIFGMKIPGSPLLYWCALGGVLPLVSEEDRSRTWSDLHLFFSVGAFVFGLLFDL